MNTRPENELTPALADAVQRMAQVPDAAVERAQHRLTHRLIARGSRRRVRPRSWMAATAAAALALVLVIGLPLLSGGSDAFAAVQANFSNFQTLRMTVTQRMDGEVLQTSLTTVDRRGRLRTDVGAQLSVIVDPMRGRVLTLLHDTREAMVSTIPAGGDGSAQLSWLEQMRQFKGRAQPLPTQRIIDGRRVRGWLVEINDTKLEVWADDDDLPVALRMLGPGALEIDYRFEFDPVLPAGALGSDIPAGYLMVLPDND